MFLNGNNIFKDHLYKMALAEDKISIFCDVADETVVHLLGWWKRFNYERYILDWDSRRIQEIGFSKQTKKSLNQLKEHWDIFKESKVAKQISRV